MPVYPLILTLTLPLISLGFLAPRPLLLLLPAVFPFERRGDRLLFGMCFTIWAFSPTEKSRSCLLLILLVSANLGRSMADAMFGPGCCQTDFQPFFVFAPVDSQRYLTRLTACGHRHRLFIVGANAFALRQSYPAPPNFRDTFTQSCDRQ